MRSSLLLLLFVLLNSSLCLFGPKYLAKHAQRAQKAKKEPLNPELYKSGVSQVTYTQAYFEQDLDHFNYGYGSYSTLKYNQRYLYNDTYWGGADNLSPIFVYCGNEGAIDGFWNNSGYLTDVLAQQFNAYLLFPEHRYFGLSQPFGLDSFDDDKLVYLSADQAMADIAVFLRHFKTEIAKCPDCPVIAFGGSYGGMLASWMRMKYPSIIDGAWGASAPILMFDGVTPEESFFATTTYDFGNVTGIPLCAQVIKEGFNRLDNYSNQASGTQYQQLNEIFDVCTNLSSNADIPALEDWISGAYTSMAMADYPYPTSFLTPMPGYPVSFGCQAFIGLDNSSSDQDIFTALYKSANIYYNYENTTQCNQILSDSSDSSDSSDQGIFSDDGWDVLACTQVILPMGSNGIDDMFPARPWSYSQNSEQCQQSYNVQSRYDWALNEFGGWDVSRDLAGYSNIFFSNGLLDPWHGGGVLVNISDTVVAYIMEGSAHHLDLRSPNELDPPSVTFVRGKEAEYIGQWVKEKQQLVQKRMEKIEA